MAKTVNNGYTDTAGVTATTFDRGAVNFTTDFRVKANNSGKEVVITNLTSPIDRPEYLRFAYSDISNVYTGTGVDPSAMAPTKRGVSILVQLTDVFSVTDDTDADYRIDLPVSVHLVIKVPSSEFITSALVQTQLGRLLSGLYDQGVTTTTRLDAILRGSLVPNGL